MSSRKPSSIINTAFADEVAPPKKFRVQRDATAVTPSRPASRSLSPGKLRHAVVSPLVSPMMKGLRRLSRSRRESKVLVQVSALAAVEHDEEDETSSLMPIEPALALSVDSEDAQDNHTASGTASTPVYGDAFSVLEQPHHHRNSNDTTKQSIYAHMLMPPSGRCLVPQVPEQPPPPQQQHHQSPSSTVNDGAGAAVVDLVTAAAPPAATTLPSTATSKPPLGQSITDDDQPHRPPTPTNKTPFTSSSSSTSLPVSTSNKIGTTKPHSWSSTTETGKPPSSSSAGSAESSSIPPRPKRPHRTSDESEPTNTTIKQQPKPRRARSAAPRERIPTRTSSSSSRTHTAESTEEPLPGIEKRKSDGSHSSESPSRSKQSHRNNSPLEQSHDKTSDVNASAITNTNANANTNDEKSIRKSLHPKESKHQSIVEQPSDTVSSSLEEQSKTLPRGEKEKNASHDSQLVPTKAKKHSTTRATPEQRELLHRIRSKSKDKAAAVTATVATAEPSTRTTPEQREKSARRARSRSRDKANTTETDGEEKALRRGRKPNSHSESSKTPSEDMSVNPHAQRHTTRRQTVTKHDENPSPDTGENKDEKPDSARRLELQRKNLDKETLAQVNNLKEEIKQMRTHRRKVKFGSKGNGSAIPSSDEAAGGASQPAYTISPFKAKSPSASKSRRLNLQISLNAIPQSPFHNSGTTIKSDLNSSKSTLQSSKTTVDFNSSIGAINIEDLDVGYLKPAPPPPRSEEELQLEALLKQIKKTKKLIKRTTRDVWTEREEIITLQRKNWSIRKALMQHEGPPDSLTTLNMKIEKLLRQEREIDLETDQLHEQKEMVDAECANSAKQIGQFKELFDKLHKIIVPLLPLPEDAPQEVGPSEAGAEPISPLPSPSGTHRQPVSVELPAAPHMDDMEELSMHSSQNDDDYIIQEGRGSNDEEEEVSLSLSHLRTAQSWA